MALPAPLTLGLDLVSGALVLVLAGFFARIWSVSRIQLDAIMAVGFALLGASYMTTTLSRLEVGAFSVRWDYFRLTGQLAGCVVISLGYVGARLRKPTFTWAASWSVATLGAFVLLASVFGPSRGTLPPASQLAAPAHGIMTLAWIVAAGLASRAWGSRPRPDRALVPVAFLVIGVSKYTWLLDDLTPDSDFLAFVYVWRFVAIILLLAALLAPHRGAGEPTHATT